VIVGHVDAISDVAGGTEAGHIRVHTRAKIRPLQTKVRHNH
jgi:hypothetical protein